MTPEYEKALATVKAAQETYNATADKYRKGEIGDRVFIAARAELVKANKVFDEAFSLEAARPEENR